MIKHKEFWGKFHIFCLDLWGECDQLLSKRMSTFIHINVGDIQL
jgi:hypothetical protein